VFRYDAGSTIGMGHHVRCHALASWFPNDHVSFVAGVDKKTSSVISGEASTFCLSADISVSEELEWWVAHEQGADAVIFDVSYPERVTNREETLHFIKRAGPSNAARIVIDGIAPVALADSRDRLGVDILILPYVMSERPIVSARVLAGPEYFTLPASWPARRDRQHHQVQNILITMGGADPQGLSLRALEAAKSAAGPDCSIRVIIGSAFHPDLANAIRKSAQVDSRVGLVDCAASLLEHLLWADIAVSATGLTKYELAWAGVPSVQISIDRKNAEMNEAFAAEQIALHLGAANDVETTAIGSAIAALTKDRLLREAMSRRGRDLVDGQGGGRIAGIIQDIVNARH